jgi:hypothetical protein
VNEDTATAYVIGAWQRVTIPGCKGVDGGPIAFDVSDPENPTVSGCYGGDGYTHDIQCVTYAGPDANYTGREICVAANEDTVTVLDATDPSDMQTLARVPYDTSAYTHQGWFTEDHAYFLLGDESRPGPAHRARRDIDAPVLVGADNNGNTSIGLRVNDTYRDDTAFAGTWGNYPFFDSGTVAVTGIEEGLFVLKPRVTSAAG